MGARIGKAGFGIGAPGGDLGVAHRGAVPFAVAHLPAIACRELDRLDGDRIVDAETAGDQIGRASCRERVCKYVSISVVAVSLKKKQTTACMFLTDTIKTTAYT